jgi:RNA 2',3'-cyclic 3'-phosphodiesterase
MPEQFDLPGFSPEPTSSKHRDPVPPLRQVALNSLFFAAFPTPEAALSIAQNAFEIKQAHGLTGKLIETARLHVTLHNLGGSLALPQELVDKAMAAARTVSLAAFDVAFDQMLSFRGRPGNHPLVLQASDGAPGMQALQHHLHMALAKAGLATQGMPKAHMTLLYDRKTIEKQAIAPIRCKVNEFALVYSHYGKTRHEHLGKWVLPD